MVIVFLAQNKPYWAIPENKGTFPTDGLFWKSEG